MGRSQETFNKKEVRKRKEKKRKEKQEKRLARKDTESKGGDDMIAYVDEYGNLSSTPPDPSKKSRIKAEDIEVSIPTREEGHDTHVQRTGLLTFFNDSKGFGFIRDTITKESVFVHMNNFQDDIREGDKVSFNVERGPKGLSAIDVKLTK
jgi:cold shock CspA family protein